MITVAASATDRRFVDRVVLGNGKALTVRFFKSVRFIETVQEPIKLCFLNRVCQLIQSISMGPSSRLFTTEMFGENVPSPQPGE